MGIPNKREQALAIKDGKFVEVGTNQHIQTLKTSKTRVLDVQGQTVLPGFHNTHVHGTLTCACLQLMVRGLGSKKK